MKPAPVDSYPIFTNSGQGSIDLTADSLHVKAKKSVSIRISHVTSFEKTGVLPLGKVGVKLSYYDMFGNIEVMDFAMREMNFQAFKNALKK